jgi:multicomponent Na+:H+ antiporter subunit B
MTRRARLAMFGVGAIVLAGVLAVGLAGLPAFGHYHGVYGLVLNRVTVSQRRATDVVTAVNFDYRGVDTMGEEFILFAASVGVVILLREQRGERRESEEEADSDQEDGKGPVSTSPALIAVGRSLIGPVLVLGVYVATHGQLTPGGGFQAGVILAAALIVLSVAVGRKGIAPIRPSGPVEVLEAAGAGAYVALGLGGLIAGARFLSNFLPLGTTGSLLSSGTIVSLSAAVGLEVAGAVTLIVSEFIDQRLLTGGET